MPCHSRCQASWSTRARRTVTLRTTATCARRGFLATMLFAQNHPRGQEARHHGRHGTEGRLCAEKAHRAMSPSTLGISMPIIMVDTHQEESYSSDETRDKIVEIFMNQMVQCENGSGVGNAGSSEGNRSVAQGRSHQSSTRSSRRSINKLEIEHELARAATCFWAQAVWTGQWKTR